MSSSSMQPVSKSYSLRSVPTGLVVRQLDALVEQEHSTDADVLAHIAELDVREEYLRAGYSSMQDYCVRRLRMSEDRANKRIRVGRKALAFPAIFPMMSDGRLSLSAVVMLAPHLDESTGDELLIAAASLTKAELELMLAARFPKDGARLDLPTLALNCENVTIAGEFGIEVAPGPPLVPSSAPNPANSTRPLPASNTPALFAKFTPLSSECVSIRGQLSMPAYEQFLRVRALAAHRVPSGNAAVVIELALKLAADLLDKQKFGKGVRTRPRAGQPNGRHIPSAIRQAVCERDGGCCTFTAPDGTRCTAEHGLEFDHIVPIAKGGQTTVDNLRLLCGRHNRYEAKRVLGADLIDARQEQARAETVKRKARREKQAASQATRQQASSGASVPTCADEATSCANEADTAIASESSTAQDLPGAVAPQPQPQPQPHGSGPDPEAVRADVIAALRGLKFTLAEARHGLELTAHMTEATSEQRAYAALQHLGRAHAHRTHRLAGGD